MDDITKYLFGGVALGQDQTGNIGLTYEGLVAVKALDGSFVTYDKNSDCLIDANVIGGSEKVNRMPTATVEPGDLLIIGDDPNFNAVFVVEHSDTSKPIKIINPEGIRTEYSPRLNLFGQRLHVTVFNPLSSISKRGGQTPHGRAFDERALQMMLFSGQSQDPMARVLAIQAMRGKSGGRNILEGHNLALILSIFNQSGNQSADSNMMQTMLLLQALEGEEDEEEHEAVVDADSGGAPSHEHGRPARRKGARGGDGEEFDT